MKKLLTALLLLVSLTATATTGPQCAAKTKAGNQCSRKAQDARPTCKQHDANAHRCGAKTQAGGACKVLAPAGKTCHLHPTK